MLSLPADRNRGQLKGIHCCFGYEINEINRCCRYLLIKINNCCCFFNHLIYSGTFNLWHSRYGIRAIFEVRTEGSKVRYLAKRAPRRVDKLCQRFFHDLEAMQRMHCPFK